MVLPIIHIGKFLMIPLQKDQVIPKTQSFRGHSELLLFYKDITKLSLTETKAKFLLYGLTEEPGFIGILPIIHLQKDQVL